jgi:hypothetical protein
MEILLRSLRVFAPFAFGCLAVQVVVLGGVNFHPAGAPPSSFAFICALAHAAS